YGIYFVPDSANHLDYDVIPSFAIFTICNDGTADSDEKRFQVDIVPNPAPVPTIPSSVDVDAELTKAGVVFQTITATDASTHPDGATDTLTFSMDNNGCPFAMDSNGEIYATEDLNAYRNTPCVVDITVTDSWEGVTYNTVGPTPMTIHITNINHPPNITNPSAVLPDIDTVHVFENTDEADPWAIGETISVFTPAGFDTDADTLTWEMEFVNGIGEEYFTYDPATGEITTTQDLDYETLSRNGLLTTQVDIRVYDQREYSEWRRFNIIVDDVNETPEFDQTVYHIETLEGTDTTVTLDCPSFSVTDEDLYDTRTYDLDCGGVGIFQLPTTRTPTCDAFIQQLEERDLDALGLEIEEISCEVTVYDKLGLFDTTEVRITIHEDNDNPPVLSQSSFVYTITNDSLPDLTFGSFSSTDIDIKEEHQIVTYTTSSSEFIADANGAFVNTRDWTGVNANPQITRQFTLTATDKAGNTDTADVTVHIIDVPDPTTTTTPPTTIAATYDEISSFLDDPGNFAWMIAALLLGLGMLGLMGYMCFRCFSTPGACLNTCRGGGGRSCFGRGARGGRGSRWFGRRTMVKRAPQQKRVVSKPRKIRVVEERERPVRVVEKRKPVKIIEEERPVKVVEKPTRVIEEPVKEPIINEPVKEAPAEKKSSFFDRFKSKPKPPEPKAVDKPKEWHLWGEKDFMSNDKWVG
ncbi:cadherin-18-like, partial [Ruditapes philippinarum]|uniref:cadherin-18-like n=1 Tax=Ruditapes philippinarum TaxID=129788 RepID=UPI00295BA039